MWWCRGMGMRLSMAIPLCRKLLAASKLGKWVQSHCVLGTSSCKEQHAGLWEALALPALGSRGSEQLSPAPLRLLPSKKHLRP